VADKVLPQPTLFSWLEKKELLGALRPPELSSKQVKLPNAPIAML